MLKKIACVIRNFKPVIGGLALGILLTGCPPDPEPEYDYPEISINKSTLVLEIGKEERLEASYDPIDTPYAGHTWSSSNPSVATVDDTGMVRAVAAGSCTIMVKALNGGSSASCEVRVVDEIVPVSSVKLDITEGKITVGEQLQLQATVSPASATNQNVTWKSSDSSVASVNPEGLVTANTIGNVVITATTDDGGKTAKCEIEVIDKGVVISTPTIESITSVSAFVSGSIVANGVTIKECGLCYGTTQSPTIESNKVKLEGETVGYTIKNLEPETIYYVRFYAIVDDVVKYGDQAYFSTLGPVEISVPTISDVKSNSALVNGTVMTHGLNLEESGIVYSTLPISLGSGKSVTLSGSAISYTLLGLSPETNYYVCLYAKIGGKTYLGEQAQFSTTGVIKTHFAPTDVYEKKLVLKSDAPKGVTSLDICYATHSKPTITDNVTKATVGADGKLCLTLENLTKGTTYYIRAYTRNGTQVQYYDDEVSAQTIGGNEFSINEDDYLSSVDWSVPGAGVGVCYLDRIINYEINVKGTYIVEGGAANSDQQFSKGDGYNGSIYISNGKGHFILRSIGRYAIDTEYKGKDVKEFYAFSDVITITNIETNVCYYPTLRHRLYLLH